MRRTALMMAAVTVPWLARAGREPLDEERGAPQPDVEQCFAWTRAATGVDPIADAGRPAPPWYQPVPPVVPTGTEPAAERSARFSRGYAACLASRGYGYGAP